MTQEQLIRDYINKEIKESVEIGEDNRYERILNEANGLDYEWMKKKLRSLSLWGTVQL